MRVGGPSWYSCFKPLEEVKLTEGTRVEVRAAAPPAKVRA